MNAGDALGRYEILSRIARGGMAEVWLARATGEQGFQKKVVIKTILPHLAEDPEFTRMFINEALLAARLNHPHIVQIFDLGSRDESYYIAMEHVPGRSLRQIARELRRHNKAVPTWFLLRVLAAVCDGLEYAHDLRDDKGQALGLVHRDVSPENIMVSYTGMVKVLDFGVAKATKSASLTRAGTLKGKYSYMAPEQIMGRPVDRRIDIYAIGVILYEFLTRKRPFQGGSDLELLKQITEAKLVRPRALVPTIPERLERLIMTAMARDRAVRYAGAGQLGDALHECLAEMADMRTQRDMGGLVSMLFPDTVDQVADLAPKPSSSPPLLDRIQSLQPGSAADTAARTDRWMAQVQQAFAAAPPPPPPLAAAPGGGGQSVPVDVRETEVSPPPSAEFDGGEIVFTYIRGAAAAAGEDAAEKRPGGDAGPAEPEAPESDSDSSSRLSNPFVTTRERTRGATRTAAVFGSRRSRGRKRRRPASPFTTVVAGPPPGELPQEAVDPERSAAALRHFERGLRYKREGEPAMALVEWEQARELDPENQKYRFNLERLLRSLEREGG